MMHQHFLLYLVGLQAEVFTHLIGSCACLASAGGGVPYRLEPLELTHRQLNGTVQVYSIPRFDPDDAFAFLSLVARKIGKLRKGGLPDRVQAAKVVLRDWNTGRVSGSWLNRPHKEVCTPFSCNTRAHDGKY